MPDRKNTHWMRIRLMVVIGLLLIGAATLFVRIWTLQISQSKWLEGLAKEQYLKEISLEPMRGVIVDRHGTPLAVSVMTDSIFAMPAELGDAQRTAEKLAPILKLSEVQLQKKLSERKHFTWIKRRVSPVEAEDVKKLELPGLYFTKESRRFYPAKELAGSLIGFAGDGRGLEGLELFFDSQLRGSVVLAQGLRDARGNMLLANGMGAQEADGGGIQLTIDLTIQEIMERELQRAVAESGAKSGSAVVMDPATGEILAMANTPSFNPNIYGKFSPSSWRNRAVTDCFEPGSTLKVFPLAWGLHTGVVSVGEKIDCQNGKLEVGSNTIRDDHQEGYGLLTPKEILVHSSNIGMAKIGLKLGRERISRSLQEFGFGKRSGIEFPGEAQCSLRALRKWSEMDVAAAAFGQGVWVTSLQLTGAVSTIANGGVWMRPLIVREIRGSRGQVVQHFEPDPLGQVLDPRWAEVLTQMMTAATEPGGTGTEAAIRGFKVAGKTGTAQKVDPIAGGYSKDKRVASFVGFVPAESPRVVILVVVDEPATSPYGGVVAAPAFARAGEAILAYLGIFPDKPVGPPGPRVAVSEANEKPVRLVVDPLEAQPQETAPGKPFLLPDLRGLSVRDALRTLAPHGFEITVDGSGRVVAQQPAAGTSMKQPAQVSLYLEKRPEPDPGLVSKNDGLH